MIAHSQLRAMGFTAKAIRHRVAKGRLHPLWPQVYSVGTPHVTQLGLWMAAVLTCGTDAQLSHESAAQLWRMRPRRPGRGLLHVSVPPNRDPRRKGIRVHRRAGLERAEREGIPTTSPTCTLIDLAATLADGPLESAINEADKLELVHPQQLRDAAEQTQRPGAKRLRTLLDHRTLTLTESELERLFIPIARKAGLPRPQTQALVNGHRVDFFFEELGVVVETDGGRYHRTPAQQRADRIRDHAHTLAGLTPMRFTHGQIAHEADYVERTLRELEQRLRAAARRL